LDDEGSYQAVLTSSNWSYNHFVKFRIEVKKFLYSNENSIVQSKNENDFTAIICLTLYGFVVTILFILLLWKIYKSRFSSNRNGEILQYIL